VVLNQARDGFIAWGIVKHRGTLVFTLPSDIITVIEEDEMGGECSAWGRWEMRKKFVRKSEVERPSERPRGVWGNTIIMDLK